jgi:hypothetical protein
MVLWLSVARVRTPATVVTGVLFGMFGLGLLGWGDLLHSGSRLSGRSRNAVVVGDPADARRCGAASNLWRLRDPGADSSSSRLRGSAGFPGGRVRLAFRFRSFRCRPLLPGLVVVLTEQLSERVEDVPVAALL